MFTLKAISLGILFFLAVFTPYFLNLRLINKNISVDEKFAEIIINHEERLKKLEDN